MLKIVSTVVVSVLMIIFCSCTAEKAEITASSEKEKEEIVASTEEEFDFDSLRELCEYPGLLPTPSDFEGGNPYKSEDVSVPEEVEKLLYRIGKVGEFEFIGDIPAGEVIYSALKTLEMADTHGEEKFIPIMEEINSEVFYPKEWVEKAAEEIFGEDVNIVHEGFSRDGFIYRERAGVYTPPRKSVTTVIPYIVSYSEDGRFCTAEFFYMEADMYGYQLGDSGDYYIPCNAELNENLFEKPEFIEFAESGKDLYVAEIIKEDDGSYHINDLYKKVVEPELIAEHIAMLNELENETFGIEHLGWEEENYKRLYKEKPYGEGFERGTPPDALEPSSTFYGIGMGEGYRYNGYYVDLNCEGVYPATNFSSKLEVFENLCKWFAPEVIEKSSFEDHVMDFEGEVYLLRHSKGYGMSYYGDSEIIEQSETEMTVIAKIYWIIKNEKGTAEIKFEKIDGNWIIVSVTDNYY